MRTRLTVAVKGMLKMKMFFLPDFISLFHSSWRRNKVHTPK